LGRNFRTKQLQAFKSLPGGFEPDAVDIAQRCSKHFAVIPGTSSEDFARFERIVATRVQQTYENSLP
jgi:hypothetical protein